MYLKTPNMDSQLASMSPVQLRDLILRAQQQLAHRELLVQERAAGMRYWSEPGQGLSDLDGVMLPGAGIL